MRELIRMLEEQDLTRNVRGTELPAGLYSKVLELRRLNDELIKVQADFNEQLDDLSKRLGVEGRADKVKKRMVKDIKQVLIKEKIKSVELRDTLLRLDPKTVKPKAEELIASVIDELSDDVIELLNKKKEMLTGVNYELVFRKNESFIDRMFSFLKPFVEGFGKMVSNFSSNVDKLKSTLSESVVYDYRYSSNNMKSDKDISQIIILSKEYTGAETSDDSILSLTFKVITGDGKIYKYSLEGESPYFFYNFLQKVKHGYLRQAMNMARGKAVNIGESIVDYPREGLDRSVWSASKGDTARLKGDIRKKILKVLSKYKKVNLKDIADEIRVVGSICTNQYNDDADIDVHIVPDFNKLPKDISREDLQSDIFKFFRDEVVEYVGKHPIEIYLQLNPAQDMMSDGVYDLLNNKWVKGPKITSPSFDPYERYKSIIDDVAGVVGDVDKLFGELKRDVIDYNVIRDAIGRLPKDVKSKVLDRLKSKLSEIESDVDELMKTKKEWLLRRKHSSSPTTPDQALSDIELARKWENENALFKLIDRYQYLRIIKDMERMMEDDEIDDKEIELLNSLLGIGGNNG